MCEPMTVIALVGAAVSAYGAIKQGQTEAETANANAIAADQAAGADRLKAQNDSLALSARQEQMRGKQIVAMAASGADLTSGSFLAEAERTGTMAAVDRSNLELQSLMSAWGHDFEATNLRKQSKYARQAGAIKAGASILGGIAGAGVAHGESLRLEKELADVKTGIWV
jgi:hypothetical protein